MDKRDYVKSQGQTRDHHCPQMNDRQKYKLKKLYGLTYEQYASMHESQDGGCAICGRIETSVMYNHAPVLVVDHNEFSGVVRGLLCRQCNVKLVAFDDDQWFRLAKAYLERTDASFRQE